MCHAMMSWGACRDTKNGISPLRMHFCFIFYPKHGRQGEIQPGVFLVFPGCPVLHHCNPVLLAATMIYNEDASDRLEHIY